MPRTVYDIATSLLLASALLAPAQAQTSFTGAGQNSTLDCDGGRAEIQGADNHMTIEGACSALYVQGAGNRITIDLAPRSSITVEGAGNTIIWTAPATTKPRLSISGAGNRVQRVR